MGDNSVEQLEQRVAELEATVRGLTDELVDTTERLRQLENAGRSPSNTSRSQPTERSESGGDAGENGSPPQPDATSNHPVENSADDDGALVDADGRVEGETPDREESSDEQTDTGETDDSDDIIVA
jgi:hypothetical protein